MRKSNNKNNFFKMFATFSLAVVTSFTANAQLEEIIVTATKRTENLQDVPLAISAVTGKQLNDRTIFETSDLMGSAPNLQVTSAYSKTQPNFSIRGISVANEFSASTASPIGVYVDEVYQTFRASHGQQLFDLEQVEIIRGPQGTLFGRNTTGGAVSFSTVKPALEGNTGFLTLGATERSGFKATGAVETTFNDSTMGLRLSGTTETADGYTLNPIDGKEYGEVDSQALRLAFAWQANDSLRADFKAYKAKNDSLGDLPYGIGYNPGQTNVIGFPTRNSALTGQPLAEDEVESNTGNGYRTEADGISMTWKYDSDNFSFTSITGFDQAEYEINPFDCDGTAVDICAIRYFSESESFNQDFRFSFNQDNFKAVLGVYFGTEEIFTKNEPDFFGFLDAVLPNSLFNPIVGVIDPSNPALGVIPSDGNCTALPINPNGFTDARTFFEFLGFTSGCAAVGAPPFSSILADQEFIIERPSQAIYGEMVYDFSDKLSLTLGGRYTKDDVKLRDARTLLFDEAGNVRATTIPYSFPANLSLPRVNEEEESKEFTYRAILNYHLNEETIVFANYSHGYRAGTYNALAYQDINQIFFIEPETVDAIELGLKTRLFDDRLQINGSIFQYDYENQQIAEIVGTTSFLRSADGEVKGLELEVIALPSDTLELRASLGLVDTEYDANQTFVPGGLNIGGNQFPNAPESTLILGANWAAWSNASSSVTLNMEARYMDEYFFDPFNDYQGNYPGGTADQGSGFLASRELAEGNPSYWLLDARLTYEAENYSVSVFGKNLTDEFYYVYGLNLNAFNQDYFTRGAPRTLGIEASYRF